MQREPRSDERLLPDLAFDYDLTTLYFFGKLLEIRLLPEARVLCSRARRRTASSLVVVRIDDAFA